MVEPSASYNVRYVICEYMWGIWCLHLLFPDYWILFGLQLLLLPKKVQPFHQTNARPRQFVTPRAVRLARLTEQHGHRPVIESFFRAMSVTSHPILNAIFVPFLVAQKKEPPKTLDCLKNHWGGSRRKKERPLIRSLHAHKAQACNLGPEDHVYRPVWAQFILNTVH